MTMMPPPVLPDAATDPTGYLLAAADLREDAAKAPTAARTVATYRSESLAHLRVVTEAALWRGIAERHREQPSVNGRPTVCEHCMEEWPCPDLDGAVAAAQAYLTGAQ